MRSIAVSITTSATQIVNGDNQNRNIYIHNGGGSKIYLGGSDVTTSNGYHLANNESVSILLPIGESIFGVVASGTNDITVLLPNGD